MGPTEPPPLTTGRLARALGVSAYHVTRWADSGAIPSSRGTPGGKRRFAVADAVAFARGRGMGDAAARIEAGEAGYRRAGVGGNTPRSYDPGLVAEVRQLRGERRGWGKIARALGISSDTAMRLAPDLPRSLPKLPEPAPPDPMPGRRTYSSGRAAAVLGVSAGTIARWVDDGTIPQGVRETSGRRLRYLDADAVDAMRGNLPARRGTRGWPAGVRRKAAPAPPSS